MEEDISNQAVLGMIFLVYIWIAIYCFGYMIYRTYRSRKYQHSILPYWWRNEAPWSGFMTTLCFSLFFLPPLFGSLLVFSTQFTRAELEQIQETTDTITEKYIERIENATNTKEPDEQKEATESETVKTSAIELPSLSSIGEEVSQEDRELLTRFNLVNLGFLNIIRYFTLFASIFVLLKFSKASWKDLGFNQDRLLYQMGIGIVTLFALMPLIIGMMALTYPFIDKKPHGLLVALSISDNPWVLYLSILAACITAPLIEEFLFRVVLRGWLEKKEVAFKNNALSRFFGPGAIPILISSSFFALVHFQVPNSVAPIFILGLGFGYLYRQTHSIWPSFFMHLCFNSQSMIGLLIQK